MKAPIDDELIEHLCELARLDVEKEEAEELRDELSRLIQFVSRLEACGEESPSLGARPLLRRPDQAIGSRPERLLSLSSRRAGSVVSVPRVLDAADE